MEQLPESLHFVGVGGIGMSALAQMASKGTVSMEELRQQLGDRLPGALGLAAKGLGITEQELIKLVSAVEGVEGTVGWNVVAR